MALLPNRAALLLAAACCALRGVAHAWTADGYPDCTATQGPSCTPNRRAQHHNSLLNSLFNKYCSDKGTYWLSKHNYGAAYDTVLRPPRRTRHLSLELGVGDETAASLNAWRSTSMRADFWIVGVDVALRGREAVGVGVAAEAAARVLRRQARVARAARPRSSASTPPTAPCRELRCRRASASSSTTRRTRSRTSWRRSRRCGRGCATAASTSSRT